MNKRQVRSRFNHAIDTHTPGVHRDQYWTPINQVIRELQDAGIHFAITRAEYQHENGVPVRKVWQGEVQADDGIVYWTITAAGCGSVQEPMEAYDVVGYTS